MRMGSRTLVGSAALLTLAACSRQLVLSRSVDQASAGPGAVYCLPKSLLKLQVEQTETSDTVTLEETAGADPQACYRAEFHHSVWRADDLSVTTDAQGLLSAVDVTTTDKTGEIIGKLAELAAEAAKVAAAFPAAPITRVQKKLVQLYFDPADPTAEARVNCDLDPVGYQVRIMGATWPPQPSPQAPFDGIAYRRKVHFRIEIEQKGSGGAYTLASSFSLPNAAPVETLQFAAGPLVTTTMNAKFERGTLVELKTNKPSEVLAGLSIPVDVLKAVAGIPGQLLTVRVDQLKSQKDLLEAQKALLDAQATLRAAHPGQASDPSHGVPPP